MVLRDCRGEGRQGPAVARRLAYWRRHSSGSADSSSSSTSARSASHATKDRRSLGLTERYKDFHSFRHTWKTAARGAELPRNTTTRSAATTPVVWGGPTDVFRCPT